MQRGIVLGLALWGILGKIFSFFFKTDSNIEYSELKFETLSYFLILQGFPLQLLLPNSAARGSPMETTPTPMTARPSSCAPTLTNT
jgi:hypothetical protein